MSDETPKEGFHVHFHISEGDNDRLDDEVYFPFIVKKVEEYKAVMGWDIETYSKEFGDNSNFYLVDCAKGCDLFVLFNLGDAVESHVTDKLKNEKCKDGEKLPITVFTLKEGVDIETVESREAA